MKLIITRHGETIENELGIIQGHMPGNLSKIGLKQAELLAKRFKDEKIDCIYSSSLARALDTAKTIIKSHHNASLIVTRELWEINHGEATGKKSKDFDFENRIDDYENEEDLCIRAKKYIDKLILKHKEGTILIVGHDGINQALMIALQGKNYKDFSLKNHQKNTAVNIFEIENEKLTPLTINCDKHLN